MPQPDWLPPRVRWESWSRNGEVCIAGSDPPFRHGARLANCITWLLREFASRCRHTHDETGALAFLCTGPKTPSTLAWAMNLWFDLALWDPGLIRERMRGRGGNPDACSWPVAWLEGSVYEYAMGRDPFPPVGTPRRRLLMLVKEQQAIAPARGRKLGNRTRRAWNKGLDAFASVAADAVASVLGDDEPGFLANLLVLVHEQPAWTVGPRTSLEESYRRHETIVADLAPVGEARGLPVAWHALWRLPPGMTWSEPGGVPWMRYPAVSVLAGVRVAGP